MKKLLIICFSIMSLTAFCQNRQTKNMLREIQGQWQQDDNGNVTYVRIVEAKGISKEKIYNRALNYFIYDYGNGKSAIQIKDPDLGRIVNKGLYDDVHIGVDLSTTSYIDTWHIVRIDIKENRARIILTLTEYEKKITDRSPIPSYSTARVNEEFPINPGGFYKTVMGKAFVKSHDRAIATLDRIEKAINEGNTELENDDW
ncbi:DUF4468 domain-containing protein [Fulvivirgaceae bacterium BMA10]|uniref:DUF4468 domain-containing protein n=1 Tax=Splendidivirga corallicola TaxID=3051826 RepID=A0ABT8KVN5_9BACT|nr:DUF4468 domain-containing protein [Fulvivirgaceae bacterium BMA10]